MMTTNKILFTSLIILNLIKDIISPLAKFRLPEIIETNANYILATIVVLIIILQILQYKSIEQGEKIPNINEFNIKNNQLIINIILTFYKLLIAIVFSAILTVLWLIMLSLFTMQASGTTEIIMPFLSFLLIWLILHTPSKSS